MENRDISNYVDNRKWEKKWKEEESYVYDDC